MSTDTVTAEADGSPRLRSVFRVVFEKEFIILKRYWFNTLGGLIANYVIFVLIFLGGRSFTPELLGDNLTALIVGFFIWTMSWGTFQTSAQTLTREARWGTLEQTYMTPFGLFTIVAARIAVNVTYSLLTGAFILVLMMATTGKWIFIDPVTVIPLAFVTMLSATGLGFAFGGLALVYKRVSSVFLIVEFLLLGAIAAAGQGLANLLPLAWGTDVLITVLEDGVPIWSLAPVDLLGITLVSGFYVLLGYVCFQYAIRVSKQRGLLSDY